MWASTGCNYILCVLFHPSIQTWAWRGPLFFILRSHSSFWISLWPSAHGGLQLHHSSPLPRGDSAAAKTVSSKVASAPIPIYNPRQLLGPRDLAWAEPHTRGGLSCKGPRGQSRSAQLCHWGPGVQGAPGSQPSHRPQEPQRRFVLAAFHTRLCNRRGKGSHLLS